jgi:hypothetical protein
VAGFPIGSLTVIALKNAAGIGVWTNRGAQQALRTSSLPGILAGDWVFAVGNDWESRGGPHASQRAGTCPPVGDSSTGDTLLGAIDNSPFDANMLVDIHDSAPTNDRWNYAPLR